MKIGNFTKTKNGEFTGRLETLNLSHPLTFEPVTEKDNKKAPDYRIVSSDSGIEIGAGWNQKSKSTGNPYIKTKIDDPSFPRTLWGALTGNDDGEYNLFWSRPKPGSTKETPVSETL